MLIAWSFFVFCIESGLETLSSPDADTGPVRDAAAPSRHVRGLGLLDVREINCAWGCGISTMGVLPTGAGIRYVVMTWR